MRVYELAKELGISTKELVEKIKKDSAAFAIALLSARPEQAVCYKPAVYLVTHSIRVCR